MSVAVIIAVVMVAVIVVALVVVVVRRQAEQRQVVRDRMASAPPDIVRKQTLWPPGLRNWARKPRFCAGRPPRPPLPPSWRSRAPRNWTLAPRKPSNGRFARARAPVVTMPRRLS